MTALHKVIPYGWHKKYDYTIHVGPVDQPVQGRCFWATIVSMLKEKESEKPGWAELGGWPEQRFFGDTEDEALATAHEAAKAWIDAQAQAD